MKVKRRVMRRTLSRRWLVAVFCVVCAATAAARTKTDAGVPRAECFPLERLTSAERAKAEELLLKALDSEALYTIVGSIKPMSSGFGHMRAPVKKIDLIALEERRRILAHFRCGETFYATQHYFSRLYNNERAFDAVIFNLPLLERSLRERASFWRFYGVTPNSHPLEALMVAEHDETSRRNMAYGYLFGYPDYAVEFFAEAADRETRTGVFVERDFLILPVFDPNGRFVWAVPKGHAERAEDSSIKRRAAAVLAAYRERRARYVGADRPGVVELLRDWFDDGRGYCSPGNARLAGAAIAASEPSPTRYASARGAAGKKSKPASIRRRSYRPPAAVATRKA